jgi:DNA-binding transcriptional regulator YbjK
MMTQGTEFRTGEDFRQDFKVTCAAIIQVDRTEASLLTLAIEYGKKEKAEFAATDCLLAAAEYYINHTQHSDLAKLMQDWRDRTKADLDKVLQHVKQEEQSGSVRSGRNRRS